MTLTYEEALAALDQFDDPYLRAIRNHGKQTWGLEGIRRLLAKLGDPHLAYPTIHIAGTKGKGSTAAFITQGLIESGLKTGLYVSPHLEDWRERIQVNRQLIAPDAVAQLVEDILPHTEDMPLSAFEVTTALALWHFAREGCDAAVIEVGLGGRLDATSIVEPVVSVITSISLDHTQLLGDTLAEIAAEKAAIVKSGRPVVSAPQPAEAHAVIEKRAEAQGSRLVLVGRDWHYKPARLTWAGSTVLIGGDGDMARYDVSLPGVFQAENAAVALAALVEARRAGLPVTAESMAAGLAHTDWPGRMEVLRDAPLVVVDSAHNPYSIRQLVASLDALRADAGQTGPVTVVFGCMADKDVHDMLEALLPAADRLVCVAAEHYRALPADELAAHAAQMRDATGSRQPAIETAPGPAEAVQELLTTLDDNETLLITGSLTIAGAARHLLNSLSDGAAAEPPAPAPASRGEG